MSNRKRIFENYGSAFPSLEFFCQIMDQCTENYECLVIHNGSKSNRLEDAVFWYKAAPRPDFRIGARDFWVKSAEMERMKEAAEAAGDTEPPISSTDLSRSKGPVIHVKKY
jgi:hypothetical protein